MLRYNDRRAIDCRTYNYIDVITTIVGTITLIVIILAFVVATAAVILTSSIFKDLIIPEKRAKKYFKKKINKKFPD